MSEVRPPADPCPICTIIEAFQCIYQITFFFSCPPTRWSTTLSSKVNLPHAINFRALCGANLVTLHPGVPPKRNLRTPPCGIEPFQCIYQCTIFVFQQPAQAACPQILIPPIRTVVFQCIYQSVMIESVRLSVRVCQKSAHAACPQILIPSAKCSNRGVSVDLSMHFIRTAAFQCIYQCTIFESLRFSVRVCILKWCGGVHCRVRSGCIELCTQSCRWLFNHRDARARPDHDMGRGVLRL